MNMKVLLKRLFLLVIGLSIAHLGVTLFIQADLGSDPFNVLVQGVFRTVPWPIAWSHGWTHMLMCCLIIVILLFVDKSYIKIGTVVCMFLGGPIIDLFTWLLGPVLNASLSIVIRVTMLVSGCIILAIGMSIVIKSDAGTGPNDLIAIVLSDKMKKKFGVVRIVSDICLVVVGFLLGGTFGVGTIVCAFLVGTVAQVFMPYAEKLCERVI